MTTRITVTIKRPVAARPLVQPMRAPVDPRQMQCTNAAEDKFHYVQADGLYEYWYRRASRDGSFTGELRVRIAEADMDRFLVQRNLGSMLRNEEFVKVTRRPNGWYKVTGASLAHWDAQRGVFHDALAVWLREFNLFFNPTVEAMEKAQVQTPKNEARVAIGDDGKLVLKRPVASQASLQALAAKFATR